MEESEKQVSVSRVPLNAGLGWISIDFAPKDGTEIIGYSAGNGEHITKWVENWLWYSKDISWLPTHWKPTHWKPNVKLRGAL